MAEVPEIEKIPTPGTIRPPAGAGRSCRARPPLPASSGATPGIEYLNPERTEIIFIAGDEGQAIGQGSSREEAVNDGGL